MGFLNFNLACSLKFLGSNFSVQSINPYILVPSGVSPLPFRIRLTSDRSNPLRKYTGDNWGKVYNISPVAYIVLALVSALIYIKLLRLLM